MASMDSMATKFQRYQSWHNFADFYGCSYGKSYYSELLIGTLGTIAIAGSRTKFSTLSGAPRAARPGAPRAPRAPRM